MAQSSRVVAEKKEKNVCVGVPSSSPRPPSAIIVVVVSAQSTTIGAVIGGNKAPS
jgi:hypothetical protein